MDLKSDLDAVRVARFRLRTDWSVVLRHAWSIRLSLLAAALSGLEVFMGVFTADPPLPRGTFAVLAGLVTIAAAVARLFAQKTIGSRE